LHANSTLKGQLQIEHEWKTETDTHKVQNKVIMIIIIKY
jgi:hypothetical protein